MTTNKEKIAKALNLIQAYGGIDGVNHKQWVLDQVVRALTGSEPKYDKWVKEYELDEDGNVFYNWNLGIKP